MPQIGPVKLAERAANVARLMRDVKPTDPDISMRGTSAAYLAVRIKRDRPDIAMRVEAGEFASMISAAVAAGIIKSNHG